MNNGHLDGSEQDGDNTEKMKLDTKKAETKTQEEREGRWKMAFTARMREIVPGLFLGNVKASHKRDMLRENRINAIVSLTDARWVWWNSTTREAGIPENRHKWVQCADSSTQDLLVYMSDICDFIDQTASPVLRSSSTLSVNHERDLNDKPDAILLHSRSPTVIIAYIMRKYGARQEDALALVQSKQRVKPSANLSRQLQVWEETGYQVWGDEERAVPKAPYQAFLENRAALLRNKGLTGNEPLGSVNL